MELARENPAINVTLILPSSINTPFFSHARSKTGLKAAPVPPVYEPHLVAEAITFAAENPRRDIYVGSVAKALAWVQRLAPRLTDKLMLQNDLIFKLQQTKELYTGPDNMFETIQEPGRVRGDFGKGSMAFSPYTRLDLCPNLRRGLLGGAALVGLVGLLRRK